MTTFVDRLRQRLRNPSIPFMILLILLVLAIPAAVLAPSIIRRGIEGYREARRLQEREFVEAPGTWVRPWLVKRVRIMIDASQPHEWRPTDFTRGPCAPENVVQLPVDGFREAIEYSCGELSRVQLSYAINCAETDRCNVPDEARRKLEAVIDVLDDAFANAGLAGPAYVEESTP